MIDPLEASIARYRKAKAAADLMEAQASAILADVDAHYAPFQTEFGGVDPYRVKLTCKRCLAEFSVHTEDFCTGVAAEKRWRTSHRCGQAVMIGDPEE